jgi:hypothetical protein
MLGTTLTVSPCWKPAVMNYPVTKSINEVLAVSGLTSCYRRALSRHIGIVQDIRMSTQDILKEHRYDPNFSFLIFQWNKNCKYVLPLTIKAGFKKISSRRCSMSRTSMHLALTIQYVMGCHFLRFNMNEVKYWHWASRLFYLLYKMAWKSVHTFICTALYQYEWW